MKDSEVSVSTPSTTSSPSTSSSKPSVAGPQQKQRSQREDNTYLQDEDFGEMFLRLANIHQDLRKLLGCYDFDISQPVIKVMKAYTSLCRDELEDLKLAANCRRLAQHMSRTMDLLHNISSSLEDTFEYKHRMIELVSIYVSCELKCAKEFKDRKLTTANCILHNIYKYLNAPKKDDTTSYILRMFTYMANMYSQREVMANIFQTIIPKKLVIVQRELPDRLYIQYLIVFYHWQQLQLVHEDKMSVIQFANNFMRPSKTLCTNAMYAYHLPKYTSLHTATQYILENLKFFHDLRNASIYDNRLDTDSGFLDISEDNEQSYSTGTVNINFVKLVENSVTRPALRPMVKLESQVVIATIDLTIEDTEESAHYEQDSDWVHGLQRNATKMQPGLSSLMITSQNRAALSESEIIQIESDIDEESNVLCLDDEPLSVEESAEYNEPECVNVESNELNHTEDLLHKGMEKVYNDDMNLSSGGTEPVTANVTSTSTSGEEVSRIEQIIPNSPTLNITSVRSIALTPPNNKSTHCGILPINKPISYHLSTSSELDTSGYFKRNSKIYSHSTTQTDINDCTYTTASDSTTQESGFFQTLSDKPNIIEVRSIERSQNHCNKNANIGEAPVVFAVDSDSKQVNEQTARVISSTVSNDQSDSTPKEPSLNDESYMCRRNSLHINSSPIDPNEAASKDVNAEGKSHMEENHGKNGLLSFRRSTPEVLLKIPISTASSVSPVRKVPNNEGVEDTNCKIKECSNSKSKENDVDTFNSSKVVYSVNKIQVQRESTKLTSTDYDSNEMQNPPKPNKKKLVQFTNQPMGRQRCTGIQYPIKPAIKQTAKSSINIQHTTFNTCSDGALFGRNPSLTYKKSRLIKKGMQDIQSSINANSNLEEILLRDNVSIKLSIDNIKLNSHLIISTQPTILKKLDNLLVFNTKNEVTENVIANSAVCVDNIHRDANSNNNTVQNMIPIPIVDISSTNKICNKNDIQNLVNSCDYSSDKNILLNTASTSETTNQCPQQQTHDDDSDLKNKCLELVVTTGPLDHTSEKDELGVERSFIITESKDLERFDNSAEINQDNANKDIDDAEKIKDIEDKDDAAQFVNKSELRRADGDEQNLDAKMLKKLCNDDGIDKLFVNTNKLSASTNNTENQLENGAEIELITDANEYKEMHNDERARKLNIDPQGANGNAERIQEEGNETKIASIAYDEEKALNCGAEELENNTESLHDDGIKSKADFELSKELLMNHRDYDLNINPAASQTSTESIHDEKSETLKENVGEKVNFESEGSINADSLEEYNPVKGQYTAYKEMDSILKGKVLPETKTCKDLTTENFNDEDRQKIPKIAISADAIKSTAEDKLQHNIVATNYDYRRNDENMTDQSITSSINWPEEDKNSYYVLEEFLILHKRRISQDTITESSANTIAVNSTASNNPKDKSSNVSTSLTTACFNNNNSNIPNDVELDSDLEFDFDFVFGLDFDTITPAASTTTPTSISKGASEHCIVEDEKILQQIDVTSQHIVEAIHKGADSLLASSISCPPTQLLQKTKQLSSASLCEPIRSFSSSESVCDEGIDNLSVAFVSNTAETTSFPSPISPASLRGSRVLNKTNGSSVHADSNVGLPLELGNELLINGDDDLLPSSELITDSELLKEFVTIPTVHTKSPKQAIEEDLQKLNDSSMSITNDVTDAGDILKEFIPFSTHNTKLLQQESRGKEPDHQNNGITKVKCNMEVKEIPATNVCATERLVVSSGITEAEAIPDSRFDEYGDAEDTMSPRILLENIISVDHNSSNFADQQLEIALPLKKRRKISEFQDELDLSTSAAITFTEEDDEEESHEATQNYGENKIKTSQAQSLLFVDKPGNEGQVKDPELLTTNTVVNATQTSSLSLQQQTVPQPKPILLPTNSLPPHNKQVQIVTPQIKELCIPFEMTPTNGNSNANDNVNDTINVFTTPMPESYPAEPMISIANLENLSLTNRLQRYLDALVTSIHITKTIDEAMAVTRFFQGFPNHSDLKRAVVCNDKLSIAAKLLRGSSVNSTEDEGKLLLKIYPDDSISILVENSCNDSEWIKLPTSTAAVLTNAAKSLEYWEKCNKSKQKKEQDPQLPHLQNSEKFWFYDHQASEQNVAIDFYKMNTFNESEVLNIHDFKSKAIQHRNVQLPKKDRMLLELQFAEEQLKQKSQAHKPKNVAKPIAASGTDSLKNIQTVKVAPLEQEKHKIFSDNIDTAVGSIKTHASTVHRINKKVHVNTKPATAPSSASSVDAQKFIDNHLAKIMAKEQIFSSILDKNSNQSGGKRTPYQKFANNLQDFGLHYFSNSNGSNSNDSVASSYNVVDEFCSINSNVANHTRSKHTTSHLLKSSGGNLCASETSEYLKHSKNQPAETGVEPGFDFGCARQTAMHRKQDIVHNHYNNRITNIAVDNQPQHLLDAFMQNSSFLNVEQQCRFSPALLPFVDPEPAVEENIDISQLKLPYTKASNYRKFYNTRGIKRRQDQSGNGNEVNKEQTQQQRFTPQRHHHLHHQQQQQLYQQMHNKATHEYVSLRKKTAEYEWQQRKQQQYQKQLQELVERENQAAVDGIIKVNELHSLTLTATTPSIPSLIPESSSSTATSQTFARFTNNLNLLASVSQSAEVLLPSTAVCNTYVADAASKAAELTLQPPKRGRGRPRKKPNNTQSPNTKSEIRNQNSTQSTNSKQMLLRTRRNARLNNSMEGAETAAIRPSSAVKLTTRTSSTLKNNSNTNLSNILIYPQALPVSNNKNASSTSYPTSATSTAIYNMYPFLRALPLNPHTSSSSPVPSKRIRIGNTSLPNV